MLYEHLDRDAFDALRGFVRVDERWFDFACEHEVYDGGAHAYSFCLSTLISLEVAPPEPSP